MNWEATPNWPFREKPRGPSLKGRKFHRVALKLWSGRFGGSAYNNEPKLKSAHRKVCRQGF